MKPSPVVPRTLVLLVIIVGVSSLSGCLVDRFGGAFSKQPEEFEQSASEPARKLVEQAFEGLLPEQLVDYHTHMLALGTSVKDAFIHPKNLSGVSVERLKFQVYVSATGVKNLSNADEEYVARLVRLARAATPRGKFRILAFDKHYNADGSVDLDKTTMYVPNHYVVELAKKYPDIFLPVISVHPYRPDALQELETWAKAGAKYGCLTPWVWTQQIPPSSLFIGK